MTDRRQRGPAELLRVRRNVAVGVVVGVLVGAAAYLVRTLELLGPAATSRQFPVLGPEAWFLVLALVLASGTAFLVAGGLTLATGAWVVATMENGTSS